jgi:hypothetical protein
MKITATVSPKVIVKMFGKCCISNKMGEREGEEDVGNVGSGYEKVRRKMGTVKTLKLREMIKMVRLNKGCCLQEETDSINCVCNMFYSI